MKWMIASDLHGSYYYAQQLQQAFEREQADRLLFLGDLLYHGPPQRPASRVRPQGGHPPAEREKGEAALRAGQL